MGLFSFLFGSSSTQPASKFRAGQVWAFKSPENQPDAKLTILRVESGTKAGTILHIAIFGVSYGNGQTGIQHLPFSESAVSESVTTLVRKSETLPDFEEGYQIWRQAFDEGKGGVFTGSVAEVFEMVTGVAAGDA